MTSCTENEAHRYGRFLAEMLDIVMKWHKSKETFDRECVGYPGFVTKFRVATNEAPEDAKNSKDHVDYENYRHVVHKWHFKIAKALAVCLESKDYVQIRNALTILTKILPHFPVIAKLNGVIEKRIEKVCAEEKEARKDLYIKAMSYSGQLKARKQFVMKEHEFHQVSGAKAAEEKIAPSKDEDPKKANAKKDSSVSKDRDTKSRSQSREKSMSRVERETSEDRRNDRVRDSKSRDRSTGGKDKRRDEDRHTRDKGDMGPPQSTTSTVRKSLEPSEERGKTISQISTKLGF